MAEARRFECDNCKHDIVSWSDGNPYYIDERGKKKYAYHPDPARERCIGNDSPHLCLSCGREFKIDSRKPISACRKCKSTDIVDTFDLEGRTCPYCKAGKFVGDPEFFVIS